MSFNVNDIITIKTKNHLPFRTFTYVIVIDVLNEDEYKVKTLRMEGYNSSVGAWTMNSRVLKLFDIEKIGVKDDFPELLI